MKLAVLCASAILKTQYSCETASVGGQVICPFVF